jgi:hypothetical protein
LAIDLVPMLSSGLAKVVAPPVALAIGVAVPVRRSPRTSVTV